MATTNLRIRFWWVAFLLPGICGAAGARPLKVVTSFVPVYSLTASVAGGLAEVENLLPGDVDPHDYQLRPRDLAKLQGADLLIINGLGMEDWLLKNLHSSGRGRPPVVVELAGGLGTNQLIYDLDREHPNPHVWLDPLLAQHGVTNIAQALQKADPANAAAYGRNAAACIAQLHQLDADFKAAADAFTHRDIMTDHNAFAYLARRYGLNVAGVIQEVDEVPPSPRQLGRVEDTIRKLGIKVIFTSPPVPSREVRQVASDTGAVTATLNTIEVGPLEKTTYDQEMRQNLATLEKYLR